MFRFLLLLLTFSLLTLPACTPDSNSTDDEPTLPAFDRQAMLEGWAVDAIIPAHDLALEGATDLATSAANFAASPGADGLAVLRANHRQAYLDWQSVSPYLMGKAEEINLRFRGNTYPADLALIETNIAAGNVNLDLPSNIAAQGFPTLDYLLFGGDDEALLAAGPAGNQRREYIAVLTTTLRDLLQTARNEWTDGFRAAYVANDGNSATASIDRTVNDYIFYYEKFLRAGKVGIPAGIFSDAPLADRAEALYDEGNAKALFTTALATTKDFFNNKGLADYLDALDIRRDGELLTATINHQFTAIEAAAVNVGDDFAEQVRTDNVKMLALYDEMQRLVVLLKVDMLQALSINVDYVDADGD